jgi:FtsP/CotA-like multicopper oxidase with cupredoxin domain
MRRAIIFIFSLVATACASQRPPGAVIEFPPSEGPFETTIAVDRNPAPDIVEIDLEARVAEVEVAPGRRVWMWTYNGVLPGPRIEARVGDRVIVHFRNALPEATTVHWHGLRIPAAMDGSLAVQDPVPPGGTFEYEFVVPDAGTFWYHPHVRSDEQVERGLYGAIRVRGESEPETTSDQVVVLDDLLVDETTFQLAPFDPEHAMVGRQGNLILVNGRTHPIADVRAGGLHRFRFINAATARYFRIELPGHELVRIGGDNGLFAAAERTGSILLVPGERADVLVAASTEPGTWLAWRSLPYDRGHGTGTLPGFTLFQMRTTSEPPIETPALPTVLGTFAPLPAPTTVRELRFEESDGGGHGHHGGGGHSFSFNGRSHPDGERFEARLGDVETWVLENTTEMDHPFHLHGFRFRVLDRDGVAPEILRWHDTINVPAKSTVRIGVPLEANPGIWMFHCHILEHAERGMMGELVVHDIEPADGPPSP